MVRRGHITKQGSKLVRWAAVEAIQRHPAGMKISTDRKRIEARRGTNIAKVAAARKLLTLVYYGLRDGHIRALTPVGRREHPGRNTRVAAALSDPCLGGVVADVIDPACCFVVSLHARPPAGRRDDRQPRKLGPAQPHTTLETFHHNHIQKSNRDSDLDVPGLVPVCAGPGHHQDHSSSLTLRALCLDPRPSPGAARMEPKPVKRHP
ncbi:hypothetical protein [Rhodococcus jostii]|uniref:hypothetical protein n=1 Tax=Rhodococcus jostii TaxID=132919 RepID=UPI003642A682